MLRTGVTPINSFTGARFVAAFAVILFHLEVIKFGFEAVTFFFILSGFVLAYNYGGGFFKYGTFLNNRLARVLPMHIFALILATPFYLYSRVFHASYHVHRVLSWLLTLFCLQVYWPTSWLVWRWNTPAWSISCEIFFYAAFPLLLPLIRKRATSLRRILALIGCALLVETAAFALFGIVLHAFWRSSGFESFDLAMTNMPYLSPFVRIGEFIIGIILACGIEPVRALFARERVRNIALIGALACYAVIFLLGRQAIDAHHLYTGLLARYILAAPSFAVVVAVLASGKTIVSRWLESPWMLALGAASYSMYLLHYPLVDLLSSVPLNRAVRNVLVLTFTIVASLVSHRLIEEPARLLWKNASLRLPVFSAKTRSYASVRLTPRQSENEAHG